jgi:hypothetical protein
MGVGVRSDEYPNAKWEAAALVLGLLGTVVGYTAGYLCTENPPDSLLYQDGLISPTGRD